VYTKRKHFFSMTFASGIAAALSAPLVMTIGFLFWQDHWKGAAFALNMYKCCLASVAFLVTVVVAAKIDHGSQLFPSEVFTTQAVGYLILSSTIGIVIGDWTWLQALQLLGARRVILMDSLKPFLAALFGWLFLDEEIRLPAVGGIALTVAGILIVSWEQGGEKKDPNDHKHNHNHPSRDDTSHDEIQDRRTDVEDTTAEMTNSSLSKIDLTLSGTDRSTNDDADLATFTTTNIVHMAPLRQSTKPSAIYTTHEPNLPDPRDRLNNSMLWTGYAMSLLNVGLDTYGSVLTKEYGQGMTVFEINLIRFGFAGGIMLLVSVGMTLSVRLLQDQSPQPQKEAADAAAAVTPNTTNGLTEDIPCPPVTGDDSNQPLSTPSCPWYALPIDKMTRSSWLHVSAGVALVTFITPCLTNYALFEIALALTLTLTSIGPLYALPLSYWMSTSRRDNKPTLRALAGALLAVAGIVVLAFWGTLPDDDVR
jgi:drug/metabolite transporter (DMT)-like permease